MLPIEAINATSVSFVHKRLIGAAGGFITGGPSGAVQGFIGAPTDQGGSNRARKAERAFQLSNPISNPDRAPSMDPRWSWDKSRRMWFISGPQPSPGLAPAGDCDIPFQKRDPMTGECSFFLGDRPGPDGAPSTNGTGRVVQGAFGIPAAEPDVKSSIRLECPSGMVLGRDDLCYPTEVLRRNSRWRKWRPGMKPVLTGGERRGITKARASITRARDAVAGVGLTVKKK